MKYYLYFLPRVLLVGVLLAVLPACGTFYAYHPVTVEALDGETFRPIAKAVVNYTYTNNAATRVVTPANARATTGDDGRATLQVADPGQFYTDLSVSAAGYLTYHPHGTATQVFPPSPPTPAAPSAPLPAPLPPESATSGRVVPHVKTADHTAYLYSAPAPAIELVLPDNFRGQIRVHFIPTSESPAAGQRHFVYEVPATGLLDVPLPPLLRAGDAYLLNVSAHTVNGTTVTSVLAVDPGEAAKMFGLRAVRSGMARDGSYYTFYVVGNKADEDRMRGVIPGALFR